MEHRIQHHMCERLATYNRRRHSSLTQVTPFPRTDKRPRFIGTSTSCLHPCRKFIIDMYTKIETVRLDFLRRNQQIIRTKLYQELVDSFTTEKSHGLDIEQRFVQKVNLG